MENKKVFKQLDKLVLISKKDLDEFVSKTSIDDEILPLIDVYYVMNRFIKNRKYKLTRKDREILSKAKKKKVLSLCKSNMLEDFIKSSRAVECLKLYSDWLLSLLMIPLLGAVAELACLTIVGVIYLFMWALLPLSFVVTPFVNVPFFSVNRRLRYFGRKKIKYRCLSKHLCYCGFQKIKEFFKMVDESGPSENTPHLETNVSIPPYDGSEYYLQGSGLSGYSFCNNDAIKYIINKVKSQGFILVNNQLYAKNDYKRTGLAIDKTTKTDGYIYYKITFNGSVTNFYADIKDAKIYFTEGDPFPFYSNNSSYTYFAVSRIDL